MKICVLTGKRGGFGAMRPMLRTMRDDPDFDLSLIACGMHLNDNFGYTVKEIEEDFQIDYLIPPELEERPAYLGSVARNLAAKFEWKRPDLLILYGDRGESLAAAMVATEMCIPIAHLQGGDISGTMDDRRRYAITALADLHFVSCTESAKEVWKAGAKSNVFEVGDSHLDPIFNMEYETRDTIYSMLDLDPKKPIFIVLHHPDPIDRTSGYQYIHSIMDALDDLDRQFVMIYPCDDPGWEKCVKAIEWFKGHDNIQIHKNLPSRTFLGLMAAASCIVGNSSAGIIEAPYLDLPCINVGNRQHGRLRSNNVVDASNFVDIASAWHDIQESMRPPYEKLYGNGATGLRIIEQLREWWKHDG